MGATRKEKDCQCARCGSSMGWIDCGQCGGEGGRDLYDQSPLEYAPGEWARCDWCLGEGGGWYCFSDDDSDWCQNHPSPGREDVKPSTVEWFEYEVSA